MFRTHNNGELRITDVDKKIHLSGWVEKIKTRDLGLILIELGGGRKQTTDKINFNVGYNNILRVGGLIVVVTFHSIEDKIVKYFFKEY